MQSRRSHTIPIRDLFGGNVENAFQVAREIGHFSVDVRRQIHFDRSRMRYYVPRTKRIQLLDLNVGYEDKRVHIDDDYEKFEHLLRFIVHKEFEPVQNASGLVVCRRGLIKDILHTPYSRNEWIVCACRFNDVIYICSIATDEKIQRELNASPDQRRMCAWGYKFEQYMTADRPHGVPKPSSPNYDQEEFCIVATNKIGGHTLMVRAEVDGVNTPAYAHCDFGDTSCYVEMKTSKKVPDFQDSFTFKRHKTLLWWAQSVIAGIEEIICGLRDDSGIVRSIEILRTDNLRQFGQGFWSSQTCFNFCNNFLNYVKSLLVENDHRKVYKFHFDGRGNITVSKPRDYQVLPDWFLSEAQQHYHLKELLKKLNIMD